MLCGECIGTNVNGERKQNEPSIVNAIRKEDQKYNLRSVVDDDF